MDQNPPSSSHGQQGQRGSAPTYDTSHGGHYGASAAVRNEHLWNQIKEGQRY
ncbi:hypothetical protein ONS95_013429 [Cadophora gregata]|uniref:uncharacterized protein n=1 Tax=Cadophora gregata TaxID=51156 RepID=UPI0026DC33DC|nr:uncharacterized protein ONS95_013429 [Cadophora gregata]KAK0116409.1 hypothetical protein ONS95_013429 [Cadophora gregata]